MTDNSKKWSILGDLHSSILNKAGLFKDKDKDKDKIVVPYAAGKSPQAAAKDAEKNKTNNAGKVNTENGKNANNKSNNNVKNDAVTRMVRMIEYMNKINGPKKSLEAQKIAVSLKEKYGDAAYDVLYKAIMEPTNYAKIAGNANIKTSREAVMHLVDVDKNTAKEFAGKLIQKKVEKPQSAKPKEALKGQMKKDANRAKKQPNKPKQAVVNKQKAPVRHNEPTKPTIVHNKDINLIMNRNKTRG